jgi:Ca-activated chloride channel family protein
MRFANANLIPYLIIAVIAYLVFTAFKDFRFKKLAFSNIISLNKSVGGGKNFLVFLPDALKIAGLILLIIAVLRPQQVKKESQENIKGIDIVLALDLSGSMQAEDLKPSRIEAAKAVAIKFVDGLKTDRVGLVVFAGKSFTQCPLTADYEIVKNFISQLDLKTVPVDGTAMGDGILTSVNRLENSKASKVIILATDGVNNTGEPPLEAAKVAAYKDIKIYTIGIGQKGGAPMIGQDAFGRRGQVVDQFGRPMRWEEPDEKTLKAIADITGGQYFRATNEKALADIYDSIGKLQKQDIKVKTYNKYIDKFEYFLWIGFLLLATAFLLEIFKYTRVIA